MYRLKKSLGQHFLKDENISKKIVEQLVKCSGTNVLEIGPGGGALTKYLLEIPSISNFKAVEIDEEKVSYLLKTYPSIKDKLINESFLEMAMPFTEPFSVIGNFPYNISTEIVFKLIDWKSHVSCVIGMFQKEVAQRISSHSGNKVYGVTSVLIQAYYDVFYLFDVDENSFNPPPKVKSGVIKLAPRKVPLSFKDDKTLKRIVKAAFGQRRKTLRNACKDIFEASFLKDPLFDKRAEQITVDQFAELTYKVK